MEEDSHPRVTHLTTAAGRGGWRLGLAHSDAAPRIIWIIRGQGRALIHGRQTGIPQGCLISIPAHALFSFAMGPATTGYLLTLPPEGVAPHAPPITLPLPASPIHIRVPSAATQAEITALFDSFQREQANAPAHHGPARDALATLMVAHLHREMLEQAPAPNAAADLRLARAFCAQLVRDYRSGRPMSAHAERLGVSPAHLTRCCKSATGQSAADLITDRLLHAARLLISDSAHPFSHIATHLGFGSAAYFTRFIRTHTGQNPSELRRTAQFSRPGSG